MSSFAPAPRARDGTPRRRLMRSYSRRSCDSAALADRLRAAGADDATPASHGVGRARRLRLRAEAALVCFAGHRRFGGEPDGVPAMPSYLSVALDRRPPTASDDETARLVYRPQSVNVIQVVTGEPRCAGRACGTDSRSCQGPRRSRTAFFPRKLGRRCASSLTSAGGAGRTAIRLRARRARADVSALGAANDRSAPLRSASPPTRVRMTAVRRGDTGPARRCTACRRRVRRVGGARGRAARPGCWRSSPPGR
jgi:hypothetical protein